MKLKSFSVFFFLLLFLGNGMTQTNPKQLKMDATNFFEKGKYPESLNLFLKYQRLKPADEEIKQMVGICYYHTNNISNARRYLQFVISNEKKLFGEPMQTGKQRLFVLNGSYCKYTSTLTAGFSFLCCSLLLLFFFFFFSSCFV